MLRAGALNKIISIQRLDYVPIVGLFPQLGLTPGAGLVPKESSTPVNEYGEINKEYIDQFNTRASIKPIVGNETFLAGLKNTVSHKIELRDREDFTLTPEDRLVYNNRVFDIQYILNWGEMNIGLTVLAVEKLFEE